MRRLVLLRHAPTSAVRRAAFPLDEPLDDAGRDAARALRGRLGRGDALCSEAGRARETAAAAGLAPVRVERALNECDFGTWRGRSLAELNEADPEGVAAWMGDPAAAPHGGESLAAFVARVGEWLRGQAERDGRAIAATHGGVVKAAVVTALGAPIDAFWRIDVSPLHLTELHAHDGCWTVTKVNAAVVAPGRTAEPAPAEAQA